MIIEEKYLISFLFCRYKYHLDNYSDIDTHSNFDTYNATQITKLQKSILADKRDIELHKNELGLSNLPGGTYKNLDIKTDSSRFKIDYLSKTSDNHITIEQIYSNVFPQIDYKLLLAWKIFNLKDSSDIKIINTFLIDQDKRKKRIKLTKKDFKAVEELISNLNKADKEEEPTIIINKKCSLCGAKEYCKNKVIKKDDLCLLGSIKDSQIKALNKKGIFNITQLSYTFRPRRQLKKQARKIKKHHVALKALAIREKKVFFFENIELPENRTHIYIDIETVPHRNEVYLISCIIERNKNQDFFSFWSDDTNSENEIFLDFLELISRCKNILIFHYGQIENKLFKRLHSVYNNSTTKRILENSCDLFTLIHPSVYFPTFTNGLKEIANFIGFKWSKDLQGYQSVLLRLLWEENNYDRIKKEIIEYNQDDCRALIVLYDFLKKAKASDFKSNSEHSSKIISSFELLNKERKRRYGGHLFDDPHFIIKKFDFINKCSYFDYQRNKILIKSNKTLRSRKKIHDRRTYPVKVNRTIYLNKKYICPFCKSHNIRIKDYPSSRIVVDLKFFEGGIKRWCTEYISYTHYCRACQKSFYPNKFSLYRRKYGHNLLSWIIYNHIVNRISFGKIEKTLASNFKISIGFVGSDTIYNFKTIAAKYYQQAYHRILKNMSNWQVLHIDETKVRVQGVSAYVWVFTNGNEVAFHFTSNRKSDFLNKLLVGFKGVLISDFYKGYDCLNCLKQKCLVHLIRDINDLLFKEQQNTDLIFIANEFATILSNIVTTTNQFGLRKAKLSIHKQEIYTFIQSIKKTKITSESGLKLQKRILKYQNELFQFIDYNNIPWSNNTAEHAFKHFANYRRVSNGIYTEIGLKKYLILLSIYETCRYKEIDFFSYLKSREKYIENYELKYTNRGNLKKGFDKHRLIREFE